MTFESVCEMPDVVRNVLARENAVFEQGKDRRLHFCGFRGCKVKTDWI